MLHSIPQSLPFLIASIAILFVGPALYSYPHLPKHVLSALDSFVLVAISGLVFLHILPESIALSGWEALLLTVLGFFGPLFFERFYHQKAHSAHTIALMIALFGFFLHATMDGVGLSEPVTTLQSSTLKTAIILHRFSEGLAIWWLLRPHYGIKLALAALAFMALATSTGFGVGEVILTEIRTVHVGFFQALVAGSLLHVVLHRPHPHHHHLDHHARHTHAVSEEVDDAPSMKRSNDLSASFGAVVAILFLVLLHTSVPDDHHLSLALHAEHPNDINSHSMYASFLTIFTTLSPLILGAQLLYALWSTRRNKGSSMRPLRAFITQWLIHIDTSAPWILAILFAVSVLHANITPSAPLISFYNKPFYAICACLLGLIYGGSFLKQGPRRFIGRIFSIGKS